MPTKVYVGIQGWSVFLVMIRRHVYLSAAEGKYIRSSPGGEHSYALQDTHYRICLTPYLGSYAIVRFLPSGYSSKDSLRISTKTG